MKKKEDLKNAESTLDSVQKNIETILNLDKETILKLSTVEHIADRVAAFAGSSPFIVLHVLWFGAWILLNSGAISWVIRFDPFPFSFLTLVVSLEAIFLTLLVLMSQNRMTKEADKRAHLELQINMLAEQETTIILRMVQNITKHLGLVDEIADNTKDLSETTDINSVAKKIDDNSRLK